MPKGWLKIPGVQEGDRSLAEQMLGLDPALKACAGKTVLDFGCAEGLIGIEFAKAGASSVHGIDLMTDFIAVARRCAIEAGVADRCRFERYDLGCLCMPDLLADFPARRAADIVLALAIVHKLRNPGRALKHMAALARERLVIRLPIGSKGLIACKYDPAAVCDSALVMTAEGFRLEQVLKGPRSELVQHWVRL